MLKSTIVFMVAFACIPVDALENIVVKRWEVCPEFKKQIIKHSAAFETINSTAILTSGKVSSPIDLGVNVTFKIYIEYLINGEWTEYYSIIRKNPCSVFNYYLEDMWYELQEAAGITQGVCPLPKGTYQVKNHIIDLTKLPDVLNLRAPFRATALVRKEDEVLLCVKVLIEDY